MKVKINQIKLAILMVKADMNVEQLHIKCGIGMGTLSKIRMGGKCKLETAVKIANALGVEVTDILED